MNSEIQNIVINSLLYIAAFLFYWFKNKNFDIGHLILLTWMISALTTINYFLAPLSYQFTHKITLFPFVYLFSLVIIFFLPILKFKSNDLQGIAYNKLFIQLLSIFVIILTFIPFLENLNGLIKLTIDDSSQFAKNYVRITDLNEKIQYLSKIGSRLNGYSNYFNGIIPILFFINLIHEKVNYIIIIGLFFAILNPMFASIIIGSRFVVITNILYFTFLLLLFKNFFRKETRNRILKYSGLFLLLCLILIGSITYFRFAEFVTEISIWDWITLYTGESFVNFNGDMWHIKKLTDGNNSIFYYKYLLGLYEFPDRHYLLLEPTTGIRMNVFYTFIGDFFVDFGKYFTIVIVIICSVIFLKITKFRITIQVYKIVFLCLISKVGVIGFTYFTYLNYQNETLITLLIAVTMVFLKPDAIAKRKNDV